MYEIGHIYTGVFCQQTPEQQRYRIEVFCCCSPAHTWQSVVLAHRPPISLPRTTVAPALLNELIGEVSSLASVYQKPAATFIGLGRIGAESMQRRGTEWVIHCACYEQETDAFRVRRSLADSAKTALQTVAAGQVSENLLDFDDEPAAEQPTGLAATQVLQQPAAKSILSGTSTNPLDDLVSIFGSTSLSPSVPQATATTPAGMPALDPFHGLGGVSLSSPASASSNQQEDLLGLF